MCWFLKAVLLTCRTMWESWFFESRREQLELKKAKTLGKYLLKAKSEVGPGLEDFCLCLQDVSGGFFPSEVKALMSHLQEIYESLWHHRFGEEFSCLQCAFITVVKKHVLFNHALNILHQLLIEISLLVWFVYALFGCSWLVVLHRLQTWFYWCCWYKWCIYRHMHIHI